MHFFGKFFFTCFCHFLLAEACLSPVASLTSIFTGEKMKIIFCAALIFIGAVGIFAQEKAITKAEFDVVLKNPNRFPVLAWRGKSFRSIATFETKAEGARQTDTSSKHTTEYFPTSTNALAPANAFHIIHETRLGSVITKSESISIGNKIYKRNGNEPWTEATVEVKPPAPPPPPPAPLPVNTEVDRKIEYKYLGSEKFNNQTTNVYTVIVKIKRIEPSTNKEILSVTTEKYWFSEEGVALKEEFISESRGGATSFFQRRTTVWELDANIKVEAPVVN